MGLDMYALTMKADTPRRRVDQDTSACTKADLLHFWRKHPDLHGWMEALYFRKGGAEDVFNCTSVELTLDDLDALEAAIMDGELPETCGFFFGVSDGSERDDDLVFVTKARAAIANGLAVYYSSWW